MHWRSFRARFCPPFILMFQRAPAALVNHRPVHQIEEEDEEDDEEEEAQGMPLLIGEAVAHLSPARWAVAKGSRSVKLLSCTHDISITQPALTALFLSRALSPSLSFARFNRQISRAKCHTRTARTHTRTHRAACPAALLLCC